jgi:hypothetical protein
VKDSGCAAKSRIDVRDRQPFAPWHVLKAHFVAVSGGGRNGSRSHLAYLECDCLERDGSPGRLPARAATILARVTSRSAT